MLLHLVDGTEDDVAESYRVVRGEVEAYGAGLAEKRELVALTKADALTDEDANEKRQLLSDACGRDVSVISGVSGDGLEPLLDKVLAEIAEETAPEDVHEAFAP